MMLEILVVWPCLRTHIRLMEHRCLSSLSFHHSPQGPLLLSPQLSQIRPRPVEHVAIAAADTGYKMGLRADCSVGVLPHGPCLPVRWYYRGLSILCQPEPAVG